MKNNFSNRKITIVLVSVFLFLIVLKFFYPSQNKITEIPADNIKGSVWTKYKDWPPIDLVYTWVNGSDPVHLKKKFCDALDFKNCYTKYPNINGFTDHGELKYSLRSVDMYMSWVRKIYIVTNNQIPNWLNTSNPRIQIVSLEDFYEDPSTLPSFSSPSIQHQIYRIKGLSEYFISMDDDNFITKPSWPDLLVSQDGKTFSTDFYWTAVESHSKRQRRIGHNEVKGPRLNEFLESIKYVDTLYDQTYGYAYRSIMPHAPGVFKKSIMEELHKRFPIQSQKTIRNQYRHRDDFQFQFSYFWYLIQEKEFNFEEYFQNNLADQINNNLFDTNKWNILTDALGLKYHSDSIKRITRKIARENHILQEDGMVLTLQLLKKSDYIYNALANKYSSKLKYNFKFVDSRFRFIAIGPRLSRTKFNIKEYYRNKDKINFICLNDDLPTGDHELAIKIENIMLNFLKKHYHKPSQFELKDNKRNSVLRNDGLTLDDFD
ncbi:hypothetical protein M0813_16848 [Anaeramoeba flamelloides]|uniref:Uncharacterized protein n=1 Tax=Anaeramoeba flamelloides TaxID=1746091 RepID=A0ABQ8YXT6_9EUKA|nr:hypothetical protein M0813_16848 [Anaeramoeba flamelloides]